MNHSIKPCPYCRSEAQLGERKISGTVLIRIACSDEECGFECTYQFEEEKAVKTWNDRAKLTSWLK